MTQRVVITGLGLITPAGTDPEESWSQLKAGKSGIDHIERFDTSDFDITFGGEVNAFDPEAYIDQRKVKRLDRFVQFGIAGADQALDDAGFPDGENLNPERSGVVIGSGIGGLKEIETQHWRMFEKGPSRVSPFFIPKLMMNAAPGQISMHFGLEGPNYSVSSACSSANHAIGNAYSHLRDGEADVMITGGVEAALTPSCLAGFSALKALSKRNDEPKKASRPFDKNRDGFVLSEGAGVLLMETLEHAQERDASIYAEVLGFGATADAHHITAPEPEGKGARKSINLALDDQETEKDRVTYVNAHGTSTELNDKMETQALHDVFGDHAHQLCISSTKSMIGHSLGAAAGIEAVVTALSIDEGVVHPTINQEEPDPDCDLDYVPEESREVDIDVALSNSFGFGGHNSCLALGKLD